MEPSLGVFSPLTFEFYLHSNKLWNACGYQEVQKCKPLQILIEASVEGTWSGLHLPGNSTGKCLHNGRIHNSLYGSQGGFDLSEVASSAELEPVC